MKHFSIMATIAILALTAQSVWAQGGQPRNVPVFNGLKVFGNIQVTLREGNRQSVKVRARGVDNDKVNTFVDNGVLKIKMQEGIYNKIDVRVDVIYRSLNEVTVSGSGEVYVESLIQQNSFYVDVTSGGYARMRVDVNSVEINLHSGGQLEIAGKAEHQETKVVSGAKLLAYRLESGHVTIKANTGGTAEIFVSESITGSASTGGGIRYKGSPRIENIKGNLGGEISRY
ncbi:head GIN domain-containing protein [Fulvivirgaceae bacterium BMA12]|uniref:Head GIN domain-containing protein n=1 Tax=Agaribacillus aureus TaxID=3051825 RepID=A0ABT8L7Y5_9BACT|nr:head GIN domain-containing protein [Fulvivirgaceae bacterium BMA12]